MEGSRTDNEKKGSVFEVLDYPDPDADAQTGEGKVCSKCGNYYSYDDYHKDKTAPDGYKSACKTCRRTEGAGKLSGIGLDTKEIFIEAAKRILLDKI